MLGLVYLKQAYQEGVIPSKIYTLLQDFHPIYTKAVQQSGQTDEKGDELFHQLVKLIIQQIKDPYSFQIFHQSLQTPFNYYEFGLNFIRPLIHFQNSQVLGLNYVEKIDKLIANQENVILFANHQTEPDPQIINLLLQPFYPNLGAQMIFVAGHRVINDPMAVPLSLGCNLLCIYSKKHIDHPPQEKQDKVVHNQRTLQRIGDLLSAGGKCIYVAPSGGRDRANALGHINIAPLDSQSIEVFYLMAKRAQRPTHFFPLSLLTYPLFPPPHHIEKELGEKREAYYNPAYLAFGEEIDMEQSLDLGTLDKKNKRQQRAQHIESLIEKNYQKLVHLSNNHIQTR